MCFFMHGITAHCDAELRKRGCGGAAAASSATPSPPSANDEPIDYFGKALLCAGYEYYGTERLYSGFHGTPMECDIFVGIVYYQRLRHMVSDKAQVRSTGPIDPMTRQPVKGRKNHGGVRFGEMERDALLAHGVANLVQDRLLRVGQLIHRSICLNAVLLFAVQFCEISRHYVYDLECLIDIRIYQPCSAPTSIRPTAAPSVAPS
jgi:DNA-directed RNA polymerase beta subunit